MTQVARTPDWDPRSDEVTRNQLAAYDAMREEQPVAFSELMHWSIFRHADIVRILHDHETFSNAVSRHLSVPNGMDPPNHTPYRRMIEKYFTQEHMKAYEKTSRQIAQSLINELVSKGDVDVMADCAPLFAGRSQCAFLGWPHDMVVPLIQWTQSNHQATFAQDRQEMARIAQQFEELVAAMLTQHRANNIQPEDSVTASLMHEKVNGRNLTDEEITSILRNWTVGEIGTIAASIGILIHYIAQHQDLQQKLRADFSLLPAAIDEILRIHGPLVASRRVTTRRVEIGGRTIEKGERLSLIWVSANRDPRVFADPDMFSFDRDPSDNLLYGAGIHVCPGAPLARLEMRLFMEELLTKTTSIVPAEGKETVHAVYPASGYASVPVVIK